MFRVYYTVYEHAGTKARGPSVLIGSLCALPVETLTAHSAVAAVADQGTRLTLTLLPLLLLQTYVRVLVTPKTKNEEIVFKNAAVTREQFIPLHITDRILLSYTRLYPHNSIVTYTLTSSTHSHQNSKVPYQMCMSISTSSFPHHTTIFYFLSIIPI